MMRILGRTQSKTGKRTPQKSQLINSKKKRWGQMVLIGCLTKIVCVNDRGIN